MTTGVAPIALSERDHAVLKLLDRTPATAALILKAGVTFPGERFCDERRVRERLQALAAAGLVRAWPAGRLGGGPLNYYKLTIEGFRVVNGPDGPLPSETFFQVISPSRFAHTFALAEAIVHTLAVSHERHVEVTAFFRENQLVLGTGPHEVRPDCMVQLSSGGRHFNVLVELDQSTEPLDSHGVQSVRRKFAAYEAYQDTLWEGWKRGGERGPRPYFRVAFLTKTVERAYHILWLAGELAHNKDRHLCYACTQQSYLGDGDAVRAPIFLDHAGRWQAIVDVHPSAPFLKAALRIPRPLVGCLAA